MGEATEHLAHRAGPGIGGLLNATFGNAAELIIALALLFKGKDVAVKASLTGSIMGNLLAGAGPVASGRRASLPRAAIQSDGRRRGGHDDGSGRHGHAGAGDFPRLARGDRA